MKKILLGSDVLLNLFWGRKPFSEEAAQLLTECENLRLQGCISTVAVAEVYNILVKRAPHHHVAEKLSLLLTFLETLEADKKILAMALNSDLENFEAAVNSMIAENSYAVSAIITFDISKYSQSGTPVMLPKDFLGSHEFNRDFSLILK